MSKQQQIIGLLLIATRKYKQFVPILLDDIKRNFFPNNKVAVYLFTDEPIKLEDNDRVVVDQFEIESYKFPDATLMRYKIFTELPFIEYSVCDYLFYMDVDMAIPAPVGEEIFGEIIAVQHPGFYLGGGSWETNQLSMCFTPDKLKGQYCAGGFQGGVTISYYAAMMMMKDMIHRDLMQGITPVWHDESAWNCFLAYKKYYRLVSPSYCMVEQHSLRKQWGIDHLEPKIVALKKNHEEIRS